jgi:hypothetical protein
LGRGVEVSHVAHRVEEPESRSARRDPLDHRTHSIRESLADRRVGLSAGDVESVGDEDPGECVAHEARTEHRDAAPDARLPGRTVN